MTYARNDAMFAADDGIRKAHSAIFGSAKDHPILAQLCVEMEESGRVEEMSSEAEVRWTQLRSAAREKEREEENGRYSERGLGSPIVSNPLVCEKSIPHTTIGGSSSAL